MILAKKMLIPTKEWKHKPEIENIFCNTVVAYLILNKIIPPKEWYYDLNITDSNSSFYA